MDDFDQSQEGYDDDFSSTLPIITPIYRLKEHPTWRDLGMTEAYNDDTLSYIPELPLEPLAEDETYQRSNVLNDVIILTTQQFQETACDVVVCPVSVPDERADAVLTGQDTLDIDQFVGSTSGDTTQPNAPKASIPMLSSPTSPQQYLNDPTGCGGNRAGQMGSLYGQAMKGTDSPRGSINLREDSRNLKDSVSLSLRYSVLPRATLNFVFSHDVVLQMLRAHKTMRAHEIVEIDLRQRSLLSDSALSGTPPNKEAWLYALDDQRVHTDATLRQRKGDFVCTLCQAITYHVGTIVSRFINRRFKSIFLPIPACFFSTDSNIHQHVKGYDPQDDGGSTPGRSNRTQTVGGQDSRTQGQSKLQASQSTTTWDQKVGPGSVSTRSNNTSGDGLASEDLKVTLANAHLLATDGVMKQGQKNSMLFGVQDLQPTLQIAYSLGEIDFVTNFACVIRTIRKVLENAYSQTRSQGRSYTVFDPSMRIGLAVDMNECIRYIDKKTQLSAPASRRYSTLPDTVYMLIEKVIARYFPRKDCERPPEDEDTSDEGPGTCGIGCRIRHNIASQPRSPSSSSSDTESSSGYKMNGAAVVEDGVDVEEPLAGRKQDIYAPHTLDEAFADGVGSYLMASKTPIVEEQSDCSPNEAFESAEDSHETETGDVKGARGDKDRKGSLGGRSGTYDEDDFFVPLLTTPRIGTAPMKTLTLKNQTETAETGGVLGSNIFPQVPSLTTKKGSDRDSHNQTKIITGSGSSTKLTANTPDMLSEVARRFGSGSVSQFHTENNRSRHGSNGDGESSGSECNLRWHNGRLGHNKNNNRGQHTSVYAEFGYQLAKDRIVNGSEMNCIGQESQLYGCVPLFVPHGKSINKRTVIKTPPIDTLSIVHCREKSIRGGSDVARLMDCSRVADFSKIDKMGCVIHCPPASAVSSVTIVADKLPRKEKALEMVISYLMRLIPFARDSVAARKIIVIILLGQSPSSAASGRMLPKCSDIFFEKVLKMLSSLYRDRLSRVIVVGGTVPYITILRNIFSVSLPLMQLGSSAEFLRDYKSLTETIDLKMIGYTKHQLKALKSFC